MKDLYFAFILSFSIIIITGCNPHPDRHLILNLKAGEARIDSQDLVIVEFTLDRIGPIRYRERLFSLENAQTSIQFEPVTENQFNDSSLNFIDLIMDAWAIDTLRQEEYFFTRRFKRWEDGILDSIRNFDFVSTPKYTHYIED